MRIGNRLGTVAVAAGLAAMTATLAAGADATKRVQPVPLGGSLVAQSGARAVFVFGFAKSDRANLTAQEEAVYKAAAKLVLAFSEGQLGVEVASGRMTEVGCDGQDL